MIFLDVDIQEVLGRKVLAAFHTTIDMSLVVMNFIFLVGGE
jgi:hypothetical protein